MSLKAVRGFDPSNAAITGGVIGGVRVTSIANRAKARLPLPARSNFRAVMATPPTVTFGTSSGITSPLLWPAVTSANGSSYRLGLDNFAIARAGNAVMHGTAFPDYLFTRWQNVNYGGGTLSNNTYMVSVIHDGTAIEFYVKGVTGNLLCKVDDQFVSLTPQVVPQDGSGHYYGLTFASAKARRIDFIGYNSPFGGINTAQTDTIVPAPLRGPRCIVMGDSFTEGTGSNDVDSWVSTFAEAMGWDDVWGSGVGSTGYLATAGSKLKYRDRFAGDVAAFNPDAVMFTGGINDEGSYTAAQVGAEALALFQQAAAILPNALLVAVAPFYKRGAGGLTQRVLDYKAQIKAAIQSVGGLFIDPLEMPLPTGYTPDVGTLAASASAGATTLSFTNQPSAMATYAFPDGTRFKVKAVSGVGPYTVTTDQGIQNAQASGATVTQVGDCYLVGSGRVGATTGWGNCDLYVGSDGTHPTAAGHLALGQVVAGLLTAAIG